MNAEAVTYQLTNYAAIAATRAETLPLGAERNAMVAAGQRAESFANALTHRPDDFPAQRFANIVNLIDTEMTDAGLYAIPAKAERWIADYNS